jgi:hypothetical protein
LRTGRKGRGYLDIGVKGRFFFFPECVDEGVKMIKMGILLGLLSCQNVSHWIVGLVLKKLDVARTCQHVMYSATYNDL